MKKKNGIFSVSSLFCSESQMKTTLGETYKINAQKIPWTGTFLSERMSMMESKRSKKKTERKGFNEQFKFVI